jgi:hypothetical protein
MFTPVPQAQPGCVRGQITGLDDRLADSAYRNAETALRKLHTDHRYPGSRFQVPGSRFQVLSMICYGSSALWESEPLSRPRLREQL